MKTDALDKKSGTSRSHAKSKGKAMNDIDQMELITELEKEHSRGDPPETGSFPVRREGRGHDPAGQFQPAF